MVTFLQGNGVNLISGYGRLDHEFRWKSSFAAIWLGGVAAALLVAFLVFGGHPLTPVFLAMAGAGAILTGAGLYFYFGAKIFGPAERWRREIASLQEARPIPRDAGILTPIAAVVADRYEQALARLREALTGR